MIDIVNKTMDEISWKIVTVQGYINLHKETFFHESEVKKKR